MSFFPLQLQLDRPERLGKYTIVLTEIDAPVLKRHSLFYPRVVFEIDGIEHATDKYATCFVWREYRWDGEYRRSEPAFQHSIIVVPDSLRSAEIRIPSDFVREIDPVRFGAHHKKLRVLKNAS